MTNSPLGLFAYPWDVLDEGADVVLDAVERAGLNTLYITTWYHSGMFFLPHNPRRRLYFPTPGALYFSPGEWHRRHPLAPPVSTLTDDWIGFWQDLARKCAARGIGLSAWMPVLHNSGVGNAYPGMAVHNAWGDAVTHTLCPANEAVVDLVASVMTDVVKLGVFDRVLLESIEYLPLRHGHHHEIIGVPLDGDIDFLASLSFSPALMQRLSQQGIDGEEVRRFVRDTCDHALTGVERQPLGWAALEGAVGGQLGAYLRVRESVLTEILAAAAQALRVQDGIRIGLLDFGPLYGLGPNGRRWQSGVDLDAQLPLVDEVHPTFYFTDADVLAAKIAQYREVVGDTVPQIPAIRAILPQTVDAASLAAQVAGVSGHASGATFYNYSFMRLDTLDWIRAALDKHWRVGA
ncbi:hypothetical protein [Mesorhizobium sp. YM1C-6-2]|uniref:hypothetical protein n=1 Tax=Mesorhizobium sp. YM1C-6-2 TaxID=1827501 RepID=UPI000EF23F34|nr:hypothetical protein [Mesorhizobium sp. YM1C-6-2]RLP27021.1 hypothetical protein D8676_07440 [Mesorhizobium sp. YM1C-6-2]